MISRDRKHHTNNICSVNSIVIFIYPRLLLFRKRCQTELISSIEESMRQCQLKPTCTIQNTDQYWFKFRAAGRKCTHEDKPFLFHLFECKPKISTVICPKVGFQTLECPTNFVLEPIEAFFGRHNDVSCLNFSEYKEEEEYEDGSDITYKKA